MWCVPIRFPLQHLEQRHEIPNSKDVLLHKLLQRFKAIDFAVNAMVDQFVSNRCQPFFELLNPIQNSFSLSKLLQLCRATRSEGKIVFPMR